MDFEVETFVTHSLRADGFDASEDGTGRGTPIVPVHCAPTLNAGGNRTGGDRQPGMSVDTADSLIPVAYSIMPQNSGKDYKAREVDVAQPLMAGGPVGGNQGGDFIVGPVAFDTTQITSKSNYSVPKAGDPCHPLAAGAHPPAIADQWAVRRLLPAECETLQGFPQGFTAIPYRRRKIAADEVEQSALGGAKVWQDDTGQWFTDCMADGPRYKCLGNSMAVPTIQWILSRVPTQQPERAVA